MISDPINDILEKISNNHSKDLPLELFTDERAVTDGIAFKSDLTHVEHVLVSSQTSVNKIVSFSFLNYGVVFDLYGDFLTEFKRHKVSLDRKSRAEFIGSVSPSLKDSDVSRMADIQKLTEVRT